MRFETRRKLFHMGGGSVAFLLVWSGLYPVGLAFGVLLLGIPLSLIARTRSVPGISRLLDLFERDHHRDRFPGKGAFFFIAGVTAAVLLFPRAAALAAVLGLTFGDSLAHTVGVRYGRVTNPLNPEKDLEGFMAGFLVTALLSLPFLSPLTAIIAAFMGMVVESIPVGLFLDDNLTVPLAVGTTAVLVQTHLLPLI